MQIKRPLTAHPEELSFVQIVEVLTRLANAGPIDAPGFGGLIQYPPEAQFRVLTLISWGASLDAVDRAIRQEDDRIEAAVDVPRVFEDAFRMSARRSAQAQLEEIEAQRAKTSLADEGRAAEIEKAQRSAKRRLELANTNPDRAAIELVIDLSQRLRGPVWSVRQEQAMGVLYGRDFLHALSELGWVARQVVQEDTGAIGGYVYGVTLLERMGIPMSMDSFSRLDQRERDALREDPSYSAATLPRQDVVAQLDQVYGSINGRSLEADAGPSLEDQWKRIIHDDPSDRTHIAMQGVLRRRARLARVAD